VAGSASPADIVEPVVLLLLNKWKVTKEERRT